MHARAGDDAQVGPAPGGTKVAYRGAPPATVAGGELEVARAFLPRPVDVVVAGNSDFFRAGDERVAHVAPHPHVADRLRTAGAVPLACPPLLVLGLDEVRQDVLERPAGVAELAPVVEVPGLAADVEQSVDRARPAEHLAPRPVEAATVERRLGLGPVAPVGGRIVHGLEVADRDVDPGVRVPAARFEEENSRGWVLAEARRQHAAGGARADDDVIMVRHGSLPCFVSSPIRHPKRFVATLADAA